MALLGIHELHLRLGGRTLLDNVTLHLQPGERVFLMGRNGAGKSTLLNVIAGSIAADDGRVSLQAGAHIAHLTQEIPSGLTGSARETAAAVAHSEDHEHIAERRLEAERILTLLGVSPESELSSASGGELRRVLLARALATGSELLLLDEPTNHLDIETVEWLEDYLLRLSNFEKRTIVMVTHDRAFARRLTTRVAELDRGVLYSFECGYDDFVERRKQLLLQEEAQQREFDRKLAEEEEWLRKGIKARQTRNEGRVRRLEQMRERRRSRRERAGTARMAIESAGRSGNIVIKSEGLSFGYGHDDIVSGLTTTIERGDRVGIVGPNGSGKTTLVRLLLGELTPRSGTVRRGSGLHVVYFDQMRSTLDPDKTIYENVGEGYDTVRSGGGDRHLIAYLQDFLFTKEDMKRTAGAISGGESNRLLLAKLFAQPSNVLVLDEPTNDLDAESLDLLEELLLDYDGTIILVSHDREFLDNVVTECLVLPGDGQVIEYVGGYGDWRDREQERRTAERARRRKSNGAQRRGKNKDGGDAPQQRKLGFKERRELGELPDRIAELEAEEEEIHRKLADPELYREAAGTGSSSDGAGSPRELTQRLEQLRDEIAEAYTRWEELESRA